MTHLQMPYYVGLLTAASIHGAAAQAAQVVQVVVARPRRPVSVGRLAIEFIVRRTAGQAPVELVTTASGRMRVATADVVALDLVRYPAHAGGWGNVMTVLRDLSPAMRRSGMRQALALKPTTPELQRLGHLLERVGADSIAAVVTEELRGRRSTWVPLASGASVAPGAHGRDPRWHVIVNVTLEAD